MSMTLGVSRPDRAAHMLRAAAGGSRRAYNHQLIDLLDIGHNTERAQLASSGKSVLSAVGIGVTFGLVCGSYSMTTGA